MTHIHDMILRKRDGKTLDQKEWQSFTDELLGKEIPDYQTSALLMACYLNGLAYSETVALTRAMAHSGKAYKWKNLGGPIIDKHSTGGVGDKASLIVAPLAAACGVRVPMMSGRSLGFTGGTLDKLDSIPGYKTKLADSKIETILKHVGCVIIGQSEEIAPADRILYSIRDVTGTVESIPLIVSSILSKKYAEGAKGLVFDVKFGNGALMKSTKDAKKLAHELINVGKLLGIKSSALLTQMNQPLGVAIGNRIEVIEAIQIMTGDKLLNSPTEPDDTRRLSIALTAEMILMGKLKKSRSEAWKLAETKLANGEAWEKFQKMCAAQGAKPSLFKDLSQLSLAKSRVSIRSPKNGVIRKMDCEYFGRTLIAIGGGREKKADDIDHGVGMLLHKKVGDPVRKGESILDVYYNHNPGISQLKKGFYKTIEIGSKKSVRLPLIYGRTAS